MTGNEQQETAVRKIKMFIHLTGQEASKHYDCSQEVAIALEDVENGRLHDAIDGMKAIRARLVQLQQSGDVHNAHPLT